MQELETTGQRQDGSASLRGVRVGAEVALSAAASCVCETRSGSCGRCIQASGMVGHEGAFGVVTRPARTIGVAFPCRTVSGMNVREHWAVRAKRTKQNRGETYLQLRAEAGTFQPLLPCAVTLTRIAPRELDGDNLQSALKACRDGVADWLKVDDRDARVTWSYAQERGKPKEYAVRVQVREVAA